VKNAYYTADIKHSSNQYAFGMLQPGRTYDKYPNGYRFGFNGQEKDNEVKEEENQIDFKFRAYDTRLGRFFAVDPLTKAYPYYTPYQFAGNTPIQCIDLEGKEPTYPDNFQTGITKFRTQNKNDIIQQGVAIVESVTAFSQVDAQTLLDYYDLNYNTKTTLQGQGLPHYGNQFETKKLCAYDCITSFGQGVKVLNDNYKIPINGGPNGNMRVYLTNLANKGYAGAEQSIGFTTDVSGNRVMNGSMAGDMTTMANGEAGFHFFGVAINEGEHSVMTGVQIDANGSATNYYFMDNTGTSQTFGTQQELDNEISSWSNGLEAKDRPTYFRKLENTSQDAP